MSGFTLRVQPSGVRSYYGRFGRNRRVVLGKVDTIAPDEARERCQKVLGNVAHGHHLLHGISGNDGMTLGRFIADTYATWINASRPRTAANTLEKPVMRSRPDTAWFRLHIDPLIAAATFNLGKETK